MAIGGRDPGAACMRAVTNRPERLVSGRPPASRGQAACRRRRLWRTLQQELAELCSCFAKLPTGRISPIGCIAMVSSIGTNASSRASTMCCTMLCGSSAMTLPVRSTATVARERARHQRMRARRLFEPGSELSKRTRTAVPEGASIQTWLASVGHVTRERRCSG